MCILKNERVFTILRRKQRHSWQSDSLHKGSEPWKGLESWRNGEKFTGTGTMSEGQTPGRREGYDRGRRVLL